MSKGIIQIYYGEGHGKTTAAFGNAIRAASEGKSVIIIQFLKGKNEYEIADLLSIPIKRVEKTLAKKVIDIKSMV